LRWFDLPVQNCNSQLTEPVGYHEASVRAPVVGLRIGHYLTNLSGAAEGIYHGYYVQRGDVPERPISELRNGLHRDWLSFPLFQANSLKLLEHKLAYAWWFCIARPRQRYRALPAPK